MTEDQNDIKTEEQGPRRLFRSRTDRMLGGVCGGLGHYFDVDPILFRIAAVALTLLAGAGIVLYIAALLLVPDEDAAAPVVGTGTSRGPVIAVAIVLLLIGWPLVLGAGFIAAGILVPLALLAAAGVLAWWLVSGQGPTGDTGENLRRAALGVGVLLLCCLVGFAGAWAAAAGGGTVVAVIVIAAGVALAVGAFVRPVRWLTLPAVALGLSAGLVSAAGIELHGGYGEREYRPASVGDLRDRYELGVGELVVDLRDTDLPRGDTPLRVDLGIGEARILVPEDVCVATRADVGAGAVSLFGHENGGVDIDRDDDRAAPAGTSRLVVDADVGMGELRVAHDNDRHFGRAGFGSDHDDDGGGPGNRACEERGAAR
jgi:phage shock protein PspC (stress-responsive transcriptional regulator)